jgi:hypothetical protein
MRRLLPLLLLLAGCDSLLGEQGIDFFDEEVVPELTWEFRWWNGQKGGLVVGCDAPFMEVYVDEDDLELGFVQAEPVVPTQPAAWVDVQGSRYALGLGLAVGEAVETEVTEPGMENVWAAAPFQAFLVIDGPPEPVLDALDLDPYTPSAPGDWMELFPELALRGDLSGALAPPLQGGGAPIELLFVGDLDEGVGFFSGAELGGLTAASCP